MSKQQQSNTGTKTQQQAKVAPVSKGNDKKPTFNFNFAKDEIILFDKTNYIIMAVGAVIVALGFIFMSGGASKDPNIFDAEAVYSFRRITLAPLTILLGFIVIIISIIKKPATKV